jgi:predicted house-cleaning NTP pyrophosphatase (Maf/HAM1 superfamily)
MGDRPADIVLASMSPFRRKVIEAAGVSFRVVPANVDEPLLKHDILGE